ncbi:protease I [Planctomycetales bacterium]|nr:protease I [Planctomycetales bacterium]
MSKKVAVVVVNPVNGLGLFQYLENFFENKISYKTFAVSNAVAVKTNSGVSLQTDFLISDLKGKERGYDALVFCCGDAMPSFGKNLEEPFNETLLAVLKNFHKHGKMIIGHCAAAIAFELAGISDGKHVAVHPYGKAALTKSIAADAKTATDGNLYTAESERFIEMLMPAILDVLK